MNQSYRHLRDTPQGAGLRQWYRGGIHDNIRIQTDKYGKEFGRILRGVVELSDEHDLMAIQDDLWRLQEVGCPAVVIAEMMIDCTNDYGFTIADLRDDNEIRVMVFFQDKPDKRTRYFAVTRYMDNNLVEKANQQLSKTGRPLGLVSLRKGGEQYTAELSLYLGKGSAVVNTEGKRNAMLILGRVRDRFLAEQTGKPVSHGVIIGEVAISELGSPLTPNPRQKMN